MKLRTGTLRVLLGAAVCLAPGVGLCLGQQAQPSVQGKVVQEAGGQGIRKVIVELRNANGDASQGYETATDATGQFKIEGVAAGQYTIETRREGYIPASRKEQEALIAVDAGQQVTGLVYKMQATGVITGKIVDGDGDAVPNVTVTATRTGKAARERAAQGIGVSTEDRAQGLTNDLGEYRIANIRAGQFMVQAQAEGTAGPAPSPGDRGRQRDRALYAATYYPGTLDEKQASTVRVSSGGVATANFNMLTSKAFRVSGVVGGVGNSRSAQILLLTKSGQVEQQPLGEGGQFEFPNILPGTYTARVVEVSTAEGQAPSIKMQTISSPIVVSAADVTGLQLEFESGALVNGKLREESGEQLGWSDMNVSLVPVEENGEEIPAIAMGMLSAITSLKEDGSFELKDVVGATYQLALSSRAEKLRDYYTKSVQQNGRETVETGFLASGETTLDVVVSAKGASIEGTVLDSKGQVVPTAIVASIPSSGKLGRPDSYQTEHTDERGHFVMRGMSPGGYTLVALDSMPENVRKPDFFQKYGERGEKVELQEGEKKSVGLTLIVEEGTEQ